MRGKSLFYNNKFPIMRKNSVIKRKFQFTRGKS